MEAKFEPGKGLVVDAPDNDPEAVLFGLLQAGYFKHMDSLVLAGHRGSDDSTAAVYVGRKLTCMGLAASMQAVVNNEFLSSSEEERTELA
jgi:hypothetical protein